MSLVGAAHGVAHEKKFIFFQETLVCEDISPTETTKEMANLKDTRNCIAYAYRICIY